MNPLHLLEQADHLVRLDRTRPREANLRRAVSTAYYALFHHLCQAVVAGQVGRTPTPRALSKILVRGLDHGELRQIARDFAAGAGGWKLWMRETLNGTGFEIPSEFREACRAFVRLQDARHAADYDPRWTVSRNQAAEYVSQAREAIALFDAAAGEPAHAFFLAAAPVWKGLRQRS